MGVDPVDHLPRLQLRDRPRLLDADGLAGLELVALVMGMILFRPLDDLAVERVLHPPLDLDHHRLVGLVRHDRAGENALRHSSNSLCLGLSAAGALGLQRLDLGDGAAHLANPRRLLELVGGGLEAQVELLALQLAQLLGELVVGVLRNVVKLRHDQASSSSDSPRRAITLVLIGSFSAARSNAVFAIAPGTPSSSNRIRPGFTRATQCSGLPLPEPMRTSAGLPDTGTSGKIRIQSRPWRLMWRVIARRAASICRAVIRSGSIAFRP